MAYAAPNHILSCSKLPLRRGEAIAPYKHHGMWVFDDPRVGLVHTQILKICRSRCRRALGDDVDDLERHHHFADLIGYLDE